MPTPPPQSATNPLVEETPLEEEIHRELRALPLETLLDLALELIPLTEIVAIIKDAPPAT